VKVPRRTPAARPPARDRVRPGADRGAPRPGTRAARGRRKAPVEAPAPAPTAARLEASAARRSPFTRRAAVFAAVVLLVAISLAYPAQRYVAQRQHIDALRAQVADGTARVAALEHDKALMSKDVFVEREARRRLHFVMPGDLGYRVEDPESSTGVPAAADGPAAATRADAWWERMMGSLDAAAARVEPPPVGARGKG
jgi:cell division protein FtsB